jgi:hypothetical protein
MKNPEAGQGHAIGNKVLDVFHMKSYVDKTAATEKGPNILLVKHIHVLITRLFYIHDCNATYDQFENTDTQIN